MKKEENIKEGYVKKETLLIVSILTLIIGFFGGVVLTIIKSESSSPPQASVQPVQSKNNQATSDNTSARIFQLERMTSKNPNDVEAWIELGNLYFDNKKYDKAIGAYNKSLELNPDNANVITDLGVMYRRSGRPKEAVAAFDRAMKADPRHEVSRFNKGIVLMHDLKDIQGALKVWEELVALNPAATTPSGQSISEMLKKYKNIGG
ncbi:tetratricopeptide repeat protein [Thermodesulfobacteriota bacterium]